MVGHREIIELRKQRRKPTSIFVIDFNEGDIPRGYWFAAENQMLTGSAAEVHLNNADDVSGVDLRFIVGCNVHLYSPCKERIRDLYKNAKRCRPSSLTVTDGKTFAHHEALQ